MHVTDLTVFEHLIFREESTEIVDNVIFKIIMVHFECLQKMLFHFIFRIFAHSGG